MGMFDALFGSKPVVPQLGTVTMGQAGADAMAANQANLGAEEKLAGQVNLFNQDQINKMYSGAGFDLQNITKLASDGISREMSGQLPLSDLAQQELGSVAASFGGGYGGSGMQGNRVARDLGLTETQLFGQGLSQAEQWMNNIDKIYAPGMMNVAAMQFTPQQGLAFDVEERNAKFQRNWMQNQIDAMPDPTVVGLWNASWSVVDAALSAYTGSNVNLGRVNPQGNYAGMGGGVGMDSSAGGAGFGGDSGAPAISMGGQ